MMALLIREVLPEDANGIAGILNLIIETVLDTLITVQFEREYILKFPHRGIFHVAVDRHKQSLIGLQSLEHNFARI